MTVTIGLVVPIGVGHACQVREPLHPTAVAVQQAEKRHKASVAKEATEREALEVARAARDKAILEDPDINAAAVGRRFDVSSTWVKRLRKAAAEVAE